MAELGTAAAVIQVAGVAATVSTELYDALSKIKNAPQEILNLVNDMESLGTILSNLQSALNSPETQVVVDQDDEVRRAMAGLPSLIENCEQSCRRVLDKVRPFKQGDEQADKQDDQTKLSIVSRRRSFLWYFKRKSILDSVYELQRTRSILSAAMGSVTFILTIRTPGQAAPPYDAKQIFDDDTGSAVMKWMASVESEQLTMAGDDLFSIAESVPIVPTDPQLTENLLSTVRAGKTMVAELLLDRIDVNSRSSRDGRTALSVAAEHGNANMTKMLLDHGAEVDMAQFSRNVSEGLGPDWIGGRTPLIWAASRSHSHIVEILLNHGANPNKANSAGRFPLHFCCMRDDRKSAMILLEHGADVNCRSLHHGWRPIHEAGLNRNHALLQMLLEFKPSLDVNIEPNGGCSAKAPLHMFVGHKMTESTKLLLDRGANPDLGMLENTTALHLAAAEGWLEGIELLLKKGASIDAQDALLKETPLHKAARNCQLQSCELLRAHGANEKQLNIDGLDYQAILQYAQDYPDDWNVPHVRFCFLSEGKSRD